MVNDHVFRATFSRCGFARMTHFELELASFIFTLPISLALISRF